MATDCHPDALVSTAWRPWACSCGTAWATKSWPCTTPRWPNGARDPSLPIERG